MAERIFECASPEDVKSLADTLGLALHLLFRYEVATEFYVTIDYDLNQVKITHASEGALRAFLIKFSAAKWSQLTEERVVQAEERWHNHIAGVKQPNASDSREN